MRPRKAVGLAVESMEARALLTSTPIASPTPPIIIEPPIIPYAPALNLHAVVGGSYIAPPHNPDTGTVVSILGSATLPGLGKTIIAGSINGPGFIAHGAASGDIYLVTRKGTIILNVNGPTQAGFSPLPQHFRFTVVYGSGAYQNETGGGNLILKLTPPQGPKGHFTLRIDTVPYAIPLGNRGHSA